MLGKIAKMKCSYLKWEVKYSYIEVLHIGSSHKIDQNEFETGSNVMVNRQNKNERA